MAKHNSGYGSLAPGKRAENNSIKRPSGGASPQVHGFVDQGALLHDAKGMGQGSRGPWTSAGKGKQRGK